MTDTRTVPDNRVPAVPGLERVDLAIEGMTCAACANRIQRGISKLEGVEDVRVNFANGRATVIHRSDDVAGAAKSFEDTITRLGYTVPVDHDAREAEQRRADDLFRRFVVAAALSVPVMVISMVMALHVDGWEWVVGALTTPVVFWSGWGFHRAAAKNLRVGATTMDTLVSMGSLSAFVWSAVVLVAGRFDALEGGHVYFETAAVIITLILLGKWFEARAKVRSGDAIRALAELGARTARLEDGSEIPVESLEVGDRFVVRPGERIATDGVIVAGESAIDTSMVTGEPVPEAVTVGDDVIGATVNTNGSLTVEATRVGADTALSQIVALVEQAQGSRAEVQRLADRVSAVFVPTALVVAVVTLAAWLLLGRPVDDAFTAAVAVLIIACPCALGLATPLGIMVGTGRGAQLGVIIKGGEILEDTRAIDTIVLDKTGTITEARMTLRETLVPAAIDGSEGANPDELLGLAASLEDRSEHPIAAAIAAASDVRHDVDGFVNKPGRGVVGTIAGREVMVGRALLFAGDEGVPAPVAALAEAAEAAGDTAVFVGRDGVAEAVLVVTDSIRPTSADAVAAFGDLGLDVTLLTGDNERTARAVAAEVGIDRVIAGVLPEQKAAEIERLQAGGKRVAMVGDGINDAPALALADLGIAIGTGTDVAIEASDLTIVSGDLRAVADAIALARRTLSTIRGNLFWAFAYNAAAIPLAAFGVLDPMIAAGAMGLSSVFVVTNSLRLRRFAGYRASAGRG